MFLCRLIYVSETSLQPMDAAVSEIINTAKAHNEQYDITGGLFLHDGYFVQCLEGRRGYVNQLYNSILKDIRHHNVQLLSFTDISERLFGQWSMGFLPCQGHHTTFDCLRFLPSREFNPTILTAEGANAMMKFVADELNKHARLA